MELSLKILKSKSACSDGLEWYAKNPCVAVEVCIEVLLNDKNCPQKLDWANWLLSRMFTKNQCVQYSIFAAEQVIDFYKKKYSADDRPQKAIDAAKQYLKNPSANSAAYAANAANAAAYAADAANAANAANAADKMKKKIIRYGVALIEAKS